MAYDGIVLRAVTHQLQTELVGGRIEKVYQPLERDLILQIRAGGKNHRLLVSAHAAFPRIHLAERYRSINPTEPPMFCMLLRKHLENGRIIAVNQVDNERVLHMDVELRNELGDLTTKRLIVEIMGRHSNIILIDPQSGRILDGIVHVNLSTSRHREVLPGRTYIAPPEQGKISPFRETVTRFQQKRLDAADEPFDRFLLQSYSGLSPLLSKEIAFRSQEDRQSEWETLSQWVTSLEKHDYQPCIVMDAKGAPRAFSAVDLRHLAGSHEYMDDISSCIETFFEQKTWLDTLKQKSGDLERILVSEREKVESRLEKLKESIEENQHSETFRVYGELLMANLYQLSRGMTQADLVNFYDEQGALVEISLDPALSPQENAQAYFKKYNKSKKSIPYLQEQIQLAEVEIDYMESVLQLLHQAELKDLDDIRVELQEQGYLKKKSLQRASKSGKQTNKKKLLQPDVYRSTDGIEILVGKNNMQNDYITMKLADSRETWLHAKGIPGSHVVIRSKNVEEQTLLEAAQLAAYFSKARDSAQVPVDFTLVRHVWKPNGAKPGFVLYDHQRTLYVTPDAQIVQKLRTR